MQQSPNRLMLISIVVLGICLAFYLFRNSTETKVQNEEISVSLCQVHAQLDEFDRFDDQALLSILATLKMHDFRIGQPVWGPPNNLLYLCEHRLKSGLKQVIVDQELKDIIKNNNGESRKYLTWSCA